MCPSEVGLGLVPFVPQFVVLSSPLPFSVSLRRHLRCRRPSPEVPSPERSRSRSRSQQPPGTRGIDSEMASTSSVGDVGASGTNPQTNPGWMECFAWFASMGLEFLAGMKREIITS